MFGKKHVDHHGPEGDAELHCSFCNKSQHDVQKLIAGPTVFICDECVAVCADIMADDRWAGKARAAPGAEVEASINETDAGLALKCALCGMPSPVEDVLLVAGRGVLCPGCVGEIEAAFATRNPEPAEPS
jgi:hypothetical protein